jgi:hypothetical protein
MYSVNLSYGKRYHGWGGLGGGGCESLTVLVSCPILTTFLVFLLSPKIYVNQAEDVSVKKTVAVSISVNRMTR